MNNDNSLANNNIIIDSVHCTISKNGRSDKIDPIITRLLVYFVQHSDTVISRNELAEQVWQSGFTSDDAINRSISTLRRALSKNRGEFIKTVPKKGYCFSVPEHIDIQVIEDNDNDDNGGKDSKDDTSSSDKRQNPAPVTFSNSAQQAPTKQAPIQQALATSPTDLYQKTFIAAITLLAGALLIAIFLGGYFSQPFGQDKASESDKLEVKEPAITSNKILLSAGLWQFDSTEQQNQLNDELIGQLQRSLFEQLSHDDSFDIDYQGTQITPKAYKLDAKFKSFIDKTMINLTLIHRKTDEVKERFSMTTQLTNSIESIEALSDEMAAAIRLVLLQHKWFIDYRSALDEFSYLDLEQLIAARRYTIDFFLDSEYSKDSGEKILSALERKYPNNPYLIGVRASWYAYSANGFSTNWQQRYELMFHYAQQALALDPTNLDALLTLFHYYNIRPDSRHKTSKTLNVIVRNHPFNRHTWRTKLFYKIKNLASCEDILKLINEIPNGVFTPQRIKVIERILAVCINGGDTNQLMTFQANSLAKQKVALRAMVNSLYLFEVHHDNLSAVLSYKYNNILKPRYLVENYGVNLKMGDQLQAHAMAQKISDSATGYNLWFASLYAAIHQQEGFGLDVFEQPSHSQYIDRFANLYFAVIVAQYAKTTADKSTLQRYLSERQLFDISLGNRNDAMARLIALSANGQEAEAKQVAIKLYNLLETYREAHPNSYFFYNLGRIQLISAFYCGALCIDLNAIDANQLLARWFSDNHKWWMDDARIVELFLADWSTHPLTTAYLQKIEQDKQQLKQSMGF